MNGDVIIKGAPSAKFIVNGNTGAKYNVNGMGGVQGPKGDTGERGSKGDSATVKVGTVTTGEPGTDAIVTNSGDEHDAVLNFTIPRGDTGASGAGTGDMVASEYDPTNTVKDKGGIPAYVSDAIASESPVKSVNGKTGNVVIDSASEWGNISGTLSNQTDLQSALDAKQNTIPDLPTIRSGAALGATALQSIADSSITTPKLASKAVTSDKVDWATFIKQAEMPAVSSTSISSAWAETNLGSALTVSGLDTSATYSVFATATFAEASGAAEFRLKATGANTAQCRSYAPGTLSAVPYQLLGVHPNASGQITLQRVYSGPVGNARCGLCYITILRTA